MRPTRTLLWSLFVATLALGCKKDEDSGDSDTDSGDTDTDSGDTDTDTDTGTQEFTCPTDDPNEPDDIATQGTALSAGTDILGQICAGDTDFFVLNVGEGCVVDALLDFDEQETDFDLYLYDSTETLLMPSESATSDEGILLKNNGAATTWYLEAAGYADAEGGYSIGYDCATTTCTDDGNEPDDSLADATPLPTPGTNVPGQVCLADADWFAIPVGPGCDVDVHLDFTHTPITGDLDLILRDADEILIDYSVSEDDDEDVSFANTAGATTVYAIVDPYLRAEAPYTISYTQVCPPPCTDDLFEPSDDLASAKELTSGDPPTAAQVCLFDEDWYKFTAQVGCDLDVTMTLTNTNGNLDLYLLDDQQAELDASETTADSEKVRFNNRPEGSVEETLYAVVRPVGEAQNGYNVAMLEDCAPCNDIDDEIGPNDDADHAADLAEDTPFNGQVCTGDADWFTVHDENGEGCKIVATLTYDGDEGDIDLALVDSTGDTVGEGPETNTGFEKIVHRLVVDDPADVFLRVDSVAGDEAPYELEYNVDCTPCTDAAEPNDTDAAELYELLADAEFSARQCFDDDWYEFAPTTGCEGLVTLSSSDPEADLDLHIYDGVGGPLIAESEGEYSDEQVYFDNSANDYPSILVLVDYYGGDEPLYTLEWTQDCTACTDAGTDNALGTATPQPEDTPHQGTICEGDEDWYELTANQGCAVDVLVEFDDLWGDLDAFLYDSTGGEIDHSTSADDNETIFHVNDTGGALLYVQLRGHTAATPPADNSYTVIYDTVCSCPEDGAATDHDTSLEAVEMTPNGAAYHGGICGEGAVDWFKFTGSAGCDVAAMLAFLGYTEGGAFRSDLDLLLFSSTGDLLGYSVLGDNEEEVGHTAGDSNELLFLAVVGYAIADDPPPGPTGDLGVDYDLSVLQLCP